MSNEPRYLLGRGETLNTQIEYPPGFGAPDPVYSWDEARRRLSPEIRDTAFQLSELPSDACPGGEAVAIVTLHPQYLAKSYQPLRLFRELDLHQVGSRPVTITASKMRGDKDPVPKMASELFVAGRLESFDSWINTLDTLEPKLQEEFARLEAVRAPLGSDRLRRVTDAELQSERDLFELVLHTRVNGDVVFDALRAYCRSLGVHLYDGKSLQAGGLTFVPAEVPKASLEPLSRFSFLRVIRPISHMRAFPQLERSQPWASEVETDLPEAIVTDSEICVAIFDGGLPPDSCLKPWVTQESGTDEVQLESGASHGQAVSSAVLFGSLTPGERPQAPKFHVDMHQILDSTSNESPFELYDALARLQSILSAKHYDFVNLSVGPACPVEDDEVHPWTAVIDQMLSDGETFLTSAAGNTGAFADLQERRIQVPSDALNIVTVGAADSLRDPWHRAEYSSFGPGRLPGLIKPDVLSFGGSRTEPFIHFKKDRSLGATAGTSFASPDVLRHAIAIRQSLGSEISPLGIKALLVNAAATNEAASVESGWGRINSDDSQVLECRDGEVRVIYQGKLSRGGSTRMLLPVPRLAKSSMVTLTATFVYATEVDPEDPGNYSRAGLEIRFRPNAERIDAASTSGLAKPDTFFSTPFGDEETLRKKDLKWDTVRHGVKRKRSSSLVRPAFDVHYNARFQGGQDNKARPIPYALALSIRAPRVADLYERVRQEFTTLVPLRAQVEIPIRPEI